MPTEINDRADNQADNQDEISLAEKKQQIVEAIGRVSPNFSRERSLQLWSFYEDILSAHIADMKKRGIL
jgi:hypothetical protein